MKKALPLLASLALCSLAPALACADSILSVSEIGPPVSPGNFPIVLPDYPNFVGFSFTLDRAFNDLSVTAENMRLVSVPSSTAWLTNSIGPGTTAANVIASSTFSYNFPLDVTADPFLGSLTFFANSDLDLSAGTYYFFISSVPDPGYALWGGGGPLGPVTLAPGVSNFASFWVATQFGCPPVPPSTVCSNYAFPPASAWFAPSSDPMVPFEVDASPVAEPPGIALLMGGLLTLIALRSRKRKA